MGNWQSSAHAAILQRRPLPIAQTASNRADLARFPGDNQVRVLFPQDVAVNPVARIDVGQGLLNDRVNSPAAQVG